MFVCVWGGGAAREKAGMWTQKEGKMGEPGGLVSSNVAWGECIEEVVEAHMCQATGIYGARRSRR